MKHILPERKRLHLKEFEYKGPGYAYFVTICTFGKMKHFANFAVAEIIANELEHRVKMNQIVVYCYCIMPDHLHILISFSEKYERSLQNWVSSFKRYTTRLVKEKFGIADLWQLNFYEHIVRSDESMGNIADYILFNPVRKEMVDDWRDYKYSKICI